MKVSLNWIKEYTKVDLPIDQLLDKIGSQLGAIEDVINLGEKYQGILIVKVVSCEDHPNADKLHVCMVDDGGAAEGVTRENGLVKVVCGANNVAAGQTVIWLPPGTAVPETFGKDTFILEAKELRGIVSNGMIASARELDFGDDHEGIIVVDEEFKPGTTLAEAYDLNDYIIDIENKMFTHRPDCFGILGVAREIAGIQNIQFNSPGWYLKEKLELKPTQLKLPLIVKNETPDLVPRFMAIALSGINIAPSSLRIKTCLARVGIKPINNIVDITNLMMLLTGQPLHAYDYDKVKALSNDKEAEIIVRLAKKGEKITLLGGKIIEPREDAILIATSQQPIGIGGVMGGADTEVDENTKNIILEVANFNMYSIRKTAMQNGLFTDAVTRFSKGQSPLQNPVVFAEAIDMILKTGATVASEIIDDNHSNTKQPVNISAQFINERLGLKLSVEETTKTLQNVEFKVETGQEITVTPAFWRTDIEIPEDVVEEVGRLIGFDKIPLELPKRTLEPVEVNQILQLKKQVRRHLQAAGANELLTYSFVHGSLLEKVGQNRELAYQLSNALSPDLQYYRLSILPSILEKVHPNIKAGYSQFALFEMGKSHVKGWLNDENVPNEEELLALVFAVDQKAAANYKGAPYYQAVAYLNYLLAKLNVNFELKILDDNSDSLKHAASPFATARSALIIEKESGEAFGVIGEFKNSVKKSLKLPQFITGFELSINKLISGKSFNYQPLSKYPKVEQDISLKVSNSITYKQVEQLILNQLSRITENIDFKVDPLDIYQPDEAEFKHFAFRITVTSYNETLKSKDVNQVLDKIAEVAKTELQAIRL